MGSWISREYLLQGLSELCEYLLVFVELILRFFEQVVLDRLGSSGQSSTTRIG